MTIGRIKIMRRSRVEDKERRAPGRPGRSRLRFTVLGMAPNGPASQCQNPTEV